MRKIVIELVGRAPEPLDFPDADLLDEFVDEFQAYLDGKKKSKRGFSWRKDGQTIFINFSHVIRMTLQEADSDELPKK
jgi:hypothetical protein